MGCLLNKCYEDELSSNSTDSIDISNSEYVCKTPTNAFINPLSSPPPLIRNIKKKTRRTLSF